MGYILGNVLTEDRRILTVCFMHRRFIVRVSFTALITTTLLCFYTFSTLTSSDFQNLHISANGDKEYDEDLRRQKEHFSNQTFRINLTQLQYNPLDNNRNDETYFRVVPQVTCATAVRIGRLDDGGKWSCNPWRAPPDCVTYSLGVNNEVSFELDMYKVTEGRCRTYSFDSTINTSLDLFQPFNGTFLNWKISAITDESKSEYSIVDIAKNFNHSKIDFFKCDIEGAENDVFRVFFNSTEFQTGSIRICQIYIELHGWSYKIADMLSMFEYYEFYMFYKEPNYADPKCCHEFSYIHKSCLLEYGIKSVPTHMNFLNEQKTLVSNDQTNLSSIRNDEEDSESFFFDALYIFE